MVSRAFSDSVHVFVSGWNAIWLTVLGVVVTALIVLIFRGWEELKRHVIENIFIVFGGAVATWFLVFIVILVRLPSKMLAESNSNLVNVIADKKQQSITINSLRDTNQQQGSLVSTLTQRVKDLEQAGPRVVTRTLPMPEPEQRCWLSSYMGLPNSTVKGAVTATAAILHCNHKVEAPYVVQIEFDRDFIPGAGIPEDSGVFIGGSGKNGKIYQAKINSPGLLADEIFVATVYGETDQYPRPLRGDIKSLK